MKKKKALTLLITTILIVVGVGGMITYAMSNNDTAELQIPDSPVIINAYSFEDSKIYKISDGTTIITEHLTGHYYAGEYSIIINAISTIKLTNGITINAPINTIIDFNENGELAIIKIGDTILDSEGNIIES